MGSLAVCFLGDEIDARHSWSTVPEWEKPHRGVKKWDGAPWYISQPSYCPILPLLQVVSESSLGYIKEKVAGTLHRE